MSDIASRSSSEATDNMDWIFKELKSYLLDMEPKIKAVDQAN